MSCDPMSAGGRPVSGHAVPTGTDQPTTSVGLSHFLPPGDTSSWPAIVFAEIAEHASCTLDSLPHLLAELDPPARSLIESQVAKLGVLADEALALLGCERIRGDALSWLVATRTADFIEATRTASPPSTRVVAAGANGGAQ